MKKRKVLSEKRAIEYLIDQLKTIKYMGDKQAYDRGRKVAFINILMDIYGFNFKETEEMIK